MSNIEALNRDEQEKISAPVILTDIIDVFQELYPNIPRHVIFALLEVHISRMLCTKHILIDEAGKDVIPNQFLLLFMESGMGKDRLSSELDEFIFSEFKTDFKQRANEYHKLLMEQYLQQEAEDAQAAKERKQKLETRAKENSNGTSDDISNENRNANIIAF